MYFIVLCISYEFHCFMNFLCILLFFNCYVFNFFMIFFIWINSKLNKWYTKQKEDKITDLQAKMKNSLVLYTKLK